MMREAKLAIADGIAKRVGGKNNPMWRGGNRESIYLVEKQDSGFNWWQRRKVRQRLIAERGHACERCGVTDKELTLHHIDHNLYHNTDDNLMLMCRSCQMKATAEFVRASKSSQSGG